jgi:hypothetical protein
MNVSYYCTTTVISGPWTVTSGKVRRSKFLQNVYSFGRPSFDWNLTSWFLRVLFMFLAAPRSGAGRNRRVKTTQICVEVIVVIDYCCSEGGTFGFSEYDPLGCAISLQARGFRLEWCKTNSSTSSHSTPELCASEMLYCHPHCLYSPFTVDLMPLFPDGLLRRSVNCSRAHNWATSRKFPSCEILRCHTDLRCASSDSLNGQTNNSHSSPEPILLLSCVIPKCCIATLSVCTLRSLLI